MDLYPLKMNLLEPFQIKPELRNYLFTNKQNLRPKSGNTYD